MAAVAGVATEVRPLTRAQRAARVAMLAVSFGFLGLLLLAPLGAVLVQALNICFFVGKSTQFATLATVGGVGAAQWLATLPLVAIASVTVLYGMRVRTRLNAAAYRMWLKRALFVMAVILLLQYAYLRWAA